jgi:hypothetical protein
MLAYVRLNSLWLMLEECAKGWKATQKANNWWIQWGPTKVYPSIPVGITDAANEPVVAAGHVKHLVKTFGLGEGCVRKHFPDLYGPSPARVTASAEPASN